MMTIEVVTISLLFLNIISFWFGFAQGIKLERQDRKLDELDRQKCEWKQETSIYDNEKFYTSPHNQYDNVCGDYQMRKNVYCRTCGKRIEYVEES